VDTSSMFVELKSTTLVLWTWSRSRFCIFTRATDLDLYAYYAVMCWLLLINIRQMAPLNKMNY